MALWHEIEHGKLAGTVADVWVEERAALMPVPRPFDGFVEHTKRVSPTCLVHFERNRYSVPAPYANRPVSLRVYADRLVVAAEGQIICEHQRLIERNHHGAGQTVYDWRHYRCCSASRGIAQWRSLPELPVAFKRLQTALLMQPAATERWWRCWHWCCITTSRPCSPQWNWPWSLGLPARPIS